MQLLTLLPLALAAAVSAQDTTTSTDLTTTSTIPYSNPATTLLTQTDSNGVITGQPAAETSQPTQPAVVTEQPAVATNVGSLALVPAGFTSGTTTVTYGNQTFTVAVDGNSTSLVSRTPTPTTQTLDASGSAAATGSGAEASSSSTGAASAAGHFKAGMGALAIAGGVFALFF